MKQYAWYAHDLYTMAVYPTGIILRCTERAMGPFRVSVFGRRRMVQKLRRALVFRARDAAIKAAVVARCLA